ncbi:haloacid dehalogenase-like hydrolase [Aneurinibacillus aneurinilyticus]|jgi:phosphoserine phosphatase|uniref:phosphoserine phosphatase n=2 Tax=Aneurinibacillus aneurinilyticus TaxID=1391 RepID=U1YIV5_ANEAE|nr:hypothetical protein HMPREF0083_01190 [Aneurinibacillus aneurinilyticus ATCC 12856]
MVYKGKQMKKIIAGAVVGTFLLSIPVSSVLAANMQSPILVDSKVHTDAAAVQILDPGKWAPKNYTVVQNLIDKYGIKSPAYNSDRKPYVIFDWDNTSIMNDTEEALFIYMMDHLAFKLTPEEFTKVIKNNVPEGAFSGEYTNVKGERITLAAISKDLRRDYEYLYSHYKGLNGTQSLETVQASDQFKDFKTKLYFLYEAINGTYDTSVGYPWVLYFFANMTTEEVQQLTEASNDYNLGQALAEIKLASPESMAGEAGTVSVSYTGGLRLTPEIANLMHTFRKNGIDVYVVSASMKEVVEVFATNPKYGYNLPKENVIGIRLQKNGDTYLPALRTDWPLTVNHGKTEVIQKEIADKRGYGPLFVAGDSNGDYEMMTEFPDTELILIINRAKGGKIGKVSAIAASEMEKANPRFILQGHDENTGQWIPTEYTIKLGATEKVLLAAQK